MEESQEVALSHTREFVEKLGSSIHHMEESQEVALSHTREFVEKLGSSVQENEDSTLMRFLIAKSMDPENTAKLFVEWKKLRSTLAPLGYVPESEITDQLEAKKAYLQLFSKKGFPILLTKMCKHFPSKDQITYKKLMVYMLDKAIASSINGREQGNEMFVVIADMKDISFWNVDVGGMTSGFQIIQDYYLDRVYKIYILNMPGFFGTFWNIISRFLDKALLEKIVIVNSEDKRKEFSEEIGEEALPEEYGGQSQLVLVQDAVIPSPLNPVE